MNLTLGLFLAISAMCAASLSWAQARLPLNVHSEGRTYRGTPETLIVTNKDDTVRYFLVSAYKVANTPWADLLVARVTVEETTYQNRTYDCARGTMRWLGEGSHPTNMSQSINSVDQVSEKLVPESGLEYALARYACGL